MVLKVILVLLGLHLVHIERHASICEVHVVFVVEGLDVYLAATYQMHWLLVKEWRAPKIRLFSSVHC